MFIQLFEQRTHQVLLWAVAHSPAIRQGEEERRGFSYRGHSRLCEAGPGFSPSSHYGPGTQFLMSYSCFHVPYFSFASITAHPCVCRSVFTDASLYLFRLQNAFKAIKGFLRGRCPSSCSFHSQPHHRGMARACESTVCVLFSLHVHAGWWCRNRRHT